MSEKLSDYDYSLPEELIAQRPLPRREDSRMMVLHRRTERIEHRQFKELPTFLRDGDLLVLNNARVIAARRFSDDGAIEFLFLEKIGTGQWRSLIRPGRKMRLGASCLVNGSPVRVAEVLPDGSRVVAVASDLSVEEGGLVPLPPYMRRAADEEDRERYQTVFADVPGAVAAPTAGLHFTPEMLAKLPHAFVTLHVGAGTFQPVKVEEIAQHQ
ncbi:MAG: S-adenosylmethionine:tRNA ribosyltransferase-isomerase, partial [Verrucomicrobiota bacterium]|nr:S-adenosylmethionine:tRNA ribosyltransferase-isomerase [Verrucomicrobiota bacterium]